MIMGLFRIFGVIIILLAFLSLYIFANLIGLDTKKLLWYYIFKLLDWNDIKSDDIICKEFEYKYEHYLDK